MAAISSIAMALASPIPSTSDPVVRDPIDINVAGDKHAVTLLTPPNSVSPNLPAFGIVPTAEDSVPPINIEQETDAQDFDEDRDMVDDADLPLEPAGMPLSKGALSGLDASAAITPAMLAKHHLPGIMLGNGPRPIRYVMGELTQSVPGFSRIPPAKARRLVVAALESRHGGGPNGNVTFSKTGWGRWDAHIKGSSRDSGIGSFNDGHLSPPRSERSSYALSNGDSAVHMPVPRIPGARERRSRGSWTASSLREEDEYELDLDEPENEADKMSLDNDEEPRDYQSDSSSMNDDTDDDDWAAVGHAALRKASLPTPGAPRLNYNSISISNVQPSRSWSRRPSAGFNSRRGSYQQHSASASFPYRNPFATSNAAIARTLDPSAATPEEQAAVAALLSLGSM